MNNGGFVITNICKTVSCTTGPVGHQGPQGVVGVTGISGAIGATGPMGTVGDKFYPRYMRHAKEASCFFCKKDLHGKYYCNCDFQYMKHDDYERFVFRISKGLLECRIEVCNLIKENECQVIVNDKPIYFDFLIGPDEKEKLFSKIETYILLK